MLGDNGILIVIGVVVLALFFVLFSIRSPVSTAAPPPKSR